jgi:23S rRNA (cytosine1962-C5)-methyltransferase
MNAISIISPEKWQDYSLLDCGDFKKLERFGNYITIRPEPQAVWKPMENYTVWKSKADVEFIPKSSSSGEWRKYKSMPDNWEMQYLLGKKNLIFNLALTKFKHIGIFPEQADNWEYIGKSLQQLQVENPKVLNLFAYTGGASLASTAFGAETYHVDSIKQVVSWANRNRLSSQLQDIRWVVEDAMKFVQRELKRGRKYHGIILDPPAYGHGPNGESWKLEDQIDNLLSTVFQLLDPEKHFFIINTYSLGFSSMILENLFLNNYPYKSIKYDCGEIFLPYGENRKLPLGVYCRGCSI